jgi:hypothetical protein
MSRGLEASASAHARWLRASTKPWFTHCVAEDWCRLGFWKFVCHLRPATDLRTHCFGASREAVLHCLPSIHEIITILNKKMSTVQLINFLHLNCTSPDIDGIDVGAFWELVTQMLLSTDIPVSYSVKTGPVYGIPTVGVRVSHTTTMGLGLTSTRDLPDGTALPSIWGEVYPLSTDDLALFLLIDRASKRSLVLGDGSLIHHLLLGPLALVNGACDIHATAVPDLDDNPRSRFGIERHRLQVCLS